MYELHLFESCGAVEGCSEHGKERLVHIKTRLFVDQLNSLNILKRDCSASCRFCTMCRILSCLLGMWRGHWHRKVLMKFLYGKVPILNRLLNVVKFCPFISFVNNMLHDYVLLHLYNWLPLLIDCNKCIARPRTQRCRKESTGSYWEYEQTLVEPH